MPMVAPDILRWARETAGLTPERAAEKLQLREAKGMPAIDRLAAFEVGEDPPTRAMLVKMAKLYRRPLLTFYLSAPPRRGARGQDFRTLPSDHSPAEEPILEALIRRIFARQSMVREVLEDEEEGMSLPFVGSKCMSDGVQDVVLSIQDTLNVALADFRAQPSPEEAFALLRGAAEEVGAFVLLIGNLGSHHTSIETEVFRGFALADEIAPFVVINDQDSKPAWSFTLLHELAHIWLGETGVSGSRADLEIEQFCNDVAGEFLLPRNELAQLSIDDPTDVRSVERQIRFFVRGRNISHSMVAYRLRRAGVIHRDCWRSLSATFRDHWRQQRDGQRRRAQDIEGGPNFYVVRGHRVGRALLDLVGRMVAAGALTTSKAGSVLGVKAKQVHMLLETRGRGSAR